MIEGVLPGGAAEAAGLTAGDVITNIDGHAISSANAVAPCCSRSTRATRSP